MLRREKGKREKTYLAQQQVDVVVEVDERTTRTAKSEVRDVVCQHNNNQTYLIRNVFNENSTRLIIVNIDDRNELPERNYDAHNNGEHTSLHPEVSTLYIPHPLPQCFPLFCLRVC